MSIITYIHNEMTLFSKQDVFWFFQNLQLSNLKTISFCGDCVQRETDRMIDTDIEAYIYRYRYLDRFIDKYIDIEAYVSRYRYVGRQIDRQIDRQIQGNYALKPPKSFHNKHFIVF